MFSRNANGTLNPWHCAVLVWLFGALGVALLLAAPAAHALGIAR